MAELKPFKWPFCGSETGVYVKEYEEGYHKFVHIHCYCCDATGLDELTKQQAIDAWNKRS